MTENKYFEKTKWLVDWVKRWYGCRDFYQLLEKHISETLESVAKGTYHPDCEPTMKRLEKQLSEKEAEIAELKKGIFADGWGSVMIPQNQLIAVLNENKSLSQKLEESTANLVETNVAWSKKFNEVKQKLEKAVMALKKYGTHGSRNGIKNSCADHMGDTGKLCDCGFEQDLAEIEKVKP